MYRRFASARGRRQRVAAVGGENWSCKFSDMPYFGYTGWAVGNFLAKRGNNSR